LANTMSEFERFQHAIAPFLSTWGSIEVKAVADISSGQVLTLVGCLSPDDPRAFEKTEPIQGLLFTRGAIPIAVLSSVLVWMGAW